MRMDKGIRGMGRWCHDLRQPLSKVDGMLADGNVSLLGATDEEKRKELIKLLR